MAPVTDWLIRGLAYAELIFVACFLGSETGRWLLRRRVILMEQLFHTIPPDRYLTWVMLPLATAITGVSISIGVNLLTSGNGRQSYTGLLVIILSLAILARYLASFAARRMPRPVTPARLRRVLAEVGDQLRPGKPIAADDAARMRTRLRRMDLLGCRLTKIAETQNWRQAVQSDRRWLTGAVLVAILLPIAGIVPILAHIANGAPIAGELRALGELLAFTAAASAAVVMRRSRCRRDLRDLGAELQTTSRTLLNRLAEVAQAPSSPSPSPAATPTLRHLWRRLIRN
jgi:hypothetical protein